MRSVVRNYLRPFALLRAFWIAVALSHLYLFGKRLVTGDWAATLDQTRLALSLVGAVYGVYATVKIEQIACRWRGSPKKFIAFLLILLVGHIAISPELPLDGTETSSAPIPWAKVVILAPALSGLIGFAHGFVKHRRTVMLPCLDRLITIQLKSFFLPHLPMRPVALWQRPPPMPCS